MGQLLAVLLTVTIAIAVTVLLTMTVILRALSLPEEFPFVHGMQGPA